MYAVKARVDMPSDHGDRSQDTEMNGIQSLSTMLMEYRKFKSVQWTEV